MILSTPEELNALLPANVSTSPERLLTLMEQTERTHIVPLDELSVLLTDKANGEGYALAPWIETIQQDAHPLVGEQAIGIGAEIEAPDGFPIVDVVTFVIGHTFVLLVIEQRYEVVRRV